KAPVTGVRGADLPTQNAARLRIPMRRLVAVACGNHGLAVVDVTDPKAPMPIQAFKQLFTAGGRLGGRGSVTAVAAGSHVDVGTADGAIPTAENDYLY